VGAPDHDAGTPVTDAGKPDASQDAGHNVAPVGAHTTGVTLAVPTVTGAVSRTYDITVPSDCDASHLHPLIFIFHGDGGKGADMYGAGFPLEQAAASAGGEAIFVYPDGTNSNIDQGGVARAWDIYHDPGFFPYAYTPGQPVPAMNDVASGNVDVDFIDAMLATFTKNYCVDTAKVFMTGMSAGGYAANQFARWRSGVVKGTAPQSGGAPFGNMDGNTGPNGSDFGPPNYCVATTGKVATLIIHGDSDGTVDVCNAVEAQSYWELANGCSNSAGNCTTSSDSCTGSKLAAPSPAPTTTSPLDPDCVATGGCGAASVVLCRVPGMGHSIWSNAPAVIWKFFASL
jgi:poly(3-hydroxybutyrate) depolymerase